MGLHTQDGRRAAKIIAKRHVSVSSTYHTYQLSIPTRNSGCLHATQASEPSNRNAPGLVCVFWAQRQIDIILIILSCVLYEYVLIIVLVYAGLCLPHRVFRIRCSRRKTGRTSRSTRFPFLWRCTAGRRRQDLPR